MSEDGKLTRLNLEEMFAIVKEANEKMHEAEGLSGEPLICLEVINGNEGPEGRMTFLGSQIWDSYEDSHDYDEVKKIISDEIQEIGRNIGLIATHVTRLVANDEW